MKSAIRKRLIYIWRGSTLASTLLLYYTILYYTILYYTILCHTILYYTILYCTILYYTILYYTILYYTILYYTILYYTLWTKQVSKRFLVAAYQGESPHVYSIRMCIYMRMYAHMFCCSAQHLEIAISSYIHQTYTLRLQLHLLKAIQTLLFLLKGRTCPRCCGRTRRSQAS